MNRVWPCDECEEVFDTEDAVVEHYQKEHPIPEVDDGFYDDDSTIIVTITRALTLAIFVLSGCGGSSPTAPNILLESEPWAEEWEAILGSKRTTDRDVSVTSISATIEGDVRGSGGDVCLYAMSQDYPATVGGYSELLCWRRIRFASGGAWSATVDLSDSPLLLPAGTTIFWGASGTYAHFRAEASGRTGVLPGASRVLRLPFADQRLDGLSLAPSHYWSVDRFPLRVRGYHVFETGRGQGDVVARPCLVWEHDGQPQAQDCQELILPAGGNFDSPPTRRLHWDIPVGDALTATCDHEGREVEADCGFFVFVEVPPDAQDIFRDYGNVDQGELQRYCARFHLEFDWHPYFQRGDGPVAQCVALFK